VEFQNRTVGYLFTVLIEKVKEIEVGIQKIIENEGGTGSTESDQV
jgi:hypothetical protein